MQKRCECLSVLSKIDKRITTEVYNYGQNAGSILSLKNVIPWITLKVLFLTRKRAPKAAKPPPFLVSENILNKGNVILCSLLWDYYTAGIRPLSLFFLKTYLYIFTHLKLIMIFSIGR